MMKHYLCLDEGSIVYVGVKKRLGMNAKRRRRTVVWARRTFTDKAGLGQAAGKLVREWELKGKRVNLILDAGVRRMDVRLPPGRSWQLRRMAENMLLARTEGEGEWDAAADIFQGEKNGAVCAALYYIRREHLKEVREILEHEGIRIGKETARTCALACAVGNLGIEECLISVELREKYVRLYGIWRQCCVCEKTLSLCPEVFIRLGGESILWEEIAQAAEAAACEMKVLADAKAVVLDRPFGPGSRDIAAFMEERLGLPCRVVELHREAYSLNMRELPAFTALPGETGLRGKKGAWGAFILCNCLAAAGVSLFFAVQKQAAQERLFILQESAKARETELGMPETEDSRRHLSVRADLEKRYGEKGQAEIWGHAVKQALGEQNRVESVRYEQEKGILEIEIAAERASEIPEIETRLNSTGAFVRAAHSMWELNEDTDQIETKMEIKLWETQTDGRD